MSENVTRKVGRPKKPNKVTWKDVFDDFKQRHPRLSKTVLRWFPSDVGEITVILMGGDQIVYDYDSHMGRRIVKED